MNDNGGVMRFGTALFLAFLVLGAMGATASAATATIGSIKVDPGGSRIEIQGDQPLTYVYRKMAGGEGIILDIAPGKPSGIPAEITGAGHVTGIWIKEFHVDGIPATRLVIGMDKDAVVNVSRDPSDSGRLLVNFPPLAAPDAPVPGDPHLTELIEPQISPAGTATSAGEAKKPKEQTDALSGKPVAAREMPSSLASEINPVPVSVPSPLPLMKPAQTSPPPMIKPVIESVIVDRNTVELVTWSAETQYDSFRLSKPERLVVDLPGAGISFQGREIKIGKYGVSRARIGVYADKVRVVFDADSSEGIPLNIIQKTPRGLKITFASKSRK